MDHFQGIKTKDKEFNIEKFGNYITKNGSLAQVYERRTLDGNIVYIGILNGYLDCLWNISGKIVFGDLNEDYNLEKFIGNCKYE